MTRIPAVLATVAVIAAGAAIPSNADARPRGAAVAAGIIGGIAAGALIGSMAGAYAYEPGYVHGYPAYGYGPAPVYGYAPYDGAYAYEPRYYRYRGYGGSTCDYVNRDRQLVGTC